MKVYHIILLVWAIIFAFWVVRQFANHNKRTERK